jgi:hypothetical protein
MGSERANYLDQRGHSGSEVSTRKTALRERRRIIALRQSGIDKTKPYLLDAKDFPGTIHFLSTDVGDVRQDVGTVHRWVEDRAALTARTGCDDDIDSLGHVLGRRRGAPTRLIVGVRMNVQQPQTIALGVDPKCGTRHGRHAATQAIIPAATFRWARRAHRRRFLYTQPRKRRHKAISADIRGLVRRNVRGLRRAWQRYARQNIRVTDVAAERLRRRYPKPRIPRPLLVALISVGVVLALTWLIWTALRHSQPAAAAHVQSYQITSDTSVSVTISVQRQDPTVPVICWVLAQAADFQPVGEQQVPIAASSHQIVNVNLVLTTLRRATAVEIKGCTLT